MKKRIFTILLMLLLVFKMLPAEAADVSDGVIPEERLLPRLVDEGDLLTDKQEGELLEKLNEISERQSCDVVVVTLDGLDGYTAMDYADDFYDYYGYGYGDERDGILLLVSMEERDWWITTCGYGITAFTDAGMDYMADQFVPELSDGNYMSAFTKFAELCDEFLTQAKEGEAYDVGNLPKGSLSPLWIFIDLPLGLLFAYISATRKKDKLTSVRKKNEAQDYAVPGSIILTVNRDVMVNKTVTSRRIERESENSTGGSTTHTSSSGTTHGGTGGKF